MSSTLSSWRASDAAAAASSSAKADCLCLGTGRFLRSVLVPALLDAGLRPALIQTRGSSFMRYMTERSDETYEVDTVLPSGDVATDSIPCYGAFSLGADDSKKDALDFVSSLDHVKVFGVGVTEAGLSSPQTQAMKDLLELLKRCRAPDNGKICVVDMDNVPNNGDRIQSHLLELTKEDAKTREFLQKSVVFLNTMVDRITSAREGSNGLVPKCEPLPAKALVILDEDGDLPFAGNKNLGVVLRSSQKQLDGDIALKLRVANGTHTALAQGLALLGFLLTDILSSSSDGAIWMDFLDSFVHQQVHTAAAPLFGDDETTACWDDWRRRLTHPNFGLSSFFITQNAAAKGGIRWGPTVANLINAREKVTVSTALAYAVLLRWLTPQADEGLIFRGWLEGFDPDDIDDSKGQEVVYADGLRYNLDAGWYEFKCACEVDGQPTSSQLAAIPRDSQPASYHDVVRKYLLAPDGGSLRDVANTEAFEVLVQSISTLLARLIVGDGLTNIMQEMQSKSHVYTEGFDTDFQVLAEGSSATKLQLLHSRQCPIPTTSKLLASPVSIESIKSVVPSEVATVQAIDLHTHLLPPSHGPLCLWGIDELLTYHYLVAEYFMTAPAEISPEDFYSRTKQEQADLVWRALFIDRSPISEACRGVVTTLQALGMADALRNRDLESVRKVYAEYRTKGTVGAQDFSDRVFAQAGLRYAIMTNVPFNSNETQYWKPNRVPYNSKYRSALRVDPLLAGDRKTVEATLRGSGYDTTLEGARQYLRDWCDTIKPEYMMASTPHDFVLQQGALAGIRDRGINTDAMKTPGAFAETSSSSEGCSPDEDNTASVVDENSDLLSEVLMKVCEERDLPVALKIGAHRGVNPKLKDAGDGVVAFADAGVLASLCTRFPNVRFLATFLSRNNQHEACVLASKFRNLHIYGCWWFCNNPSMIEEITTMRVEMLGTSFTAQHSDARVLDQLIYKWGHSRAIIANVLIGEYEKVSESGWRPTRSDIRRDVSRLFGASYEEFMKRSFLP